MEKDMQDMVKGDVETNTPAQARMSRLEILSAAGIVSYVALLFGFQAYMSYEDGKDRKAQAAIAQDAVAAYAMEDHVELTLTAEPHSLPSGDLDGAGIVRDWHSGPKEIYDTGRGYRNGVRADEAAREVVLDPRQCVWEYIGAKANAEHPVRVLAWKSSIDGSVTGELIDVSSYNDGALDESTGIADFDAAKFCNYGTRQASVVMHTDRGGVNEYNHTSGYNK